MHWNLGVIALLHNGRNLPIFNFKLLPVASQCHITLVPITWAFRPEFCISPWWSVAHICIDVVKECRSIILLLLNKDRYVHTFCYNCDGQASMDVPHVLFQCDNVYDLRLELWRKVEGEGPPNLIDHMNHLSYPDRYEFIINGFYCANVSDWKDLHVAHHQMRFYKSLITTVLYLHQMVPLKFM